jgi:UDP-GlcNAc3NAcA epimerase
MRPLKIVTIVGARPQFIKAAVVSRAMRQIESLSEVMIHTGQHFDTQMSDIFFRQLDIPEPDYHLHVHGGAHGDMTGRMLIALEPVISKEKPNWVLVYGDTNSTLAGALVASKLNIPLAHVEAGLRSFNRRMPEEINRVVADHLSSLHFCPTQNAVQNLANEGIRAGVHHVGDVMYDATLFAIAKNRGSPSIQNRLRLQPGHYAVATVHRAENTDDPAQLKKVLDFLVQCGREMPVVFPLHPRTRISAERSMASLAGLNVIEPLGYIEMAELLSGASVIYTDSGGMQKEAYFHRIPCVTLRSETEWVETIQHGWNRLWSEPSYMPRQNISDYGTGHAGQAIAEILQSAG